MLNDECECQGDGLCVERMFNAPTSLLVLDVCARCYSHFPDFFLLFFSFLVSCFYHSFKLELVLTKNSSRPMRRILESGYRRRFSPPGVCTSTSSTRLQISVLVQYYLYKLQIINNYPAYIAFACCTKIFGRILRGWAMWAMRACWLPFQLPQYSRYKDAL